MRLLFFASEFPPGPGGIGTHAYNLVQQLVKLGWEIIVITPQSHAAEEEIAEFNRSLPFTIRRLKYLPGAPLKAVYRWLVASGWIRKWQPDLLLTSGDREGYLGAQLARYFKLPWLVVEHGRLPPKWERGLKRWSFQQASALVCVSNYSWKHMTEFGIRPRKGQVIPNGADVDGFKVLPAQEVATFRNSEGLNGGSVLLTVGSVTERKGQDVVIRALPTILKDAPNTHYLIAGLPTKQSEFLALSRELGVSDHVHFLGRVDAQRLVRLINCCDIFVMTSRHTAEEFEGFGIAVVEAALCGKPAVVSLNSGLAEAIEDGKTGLGVPEEDSHSTALAILSLIGDKKKRLAMGQAARHRALTEQTWAHRAREYDSLLLSLASQM